MRHCLWIALTIVIDIIIIIIYFRYTCTLVL